MPTVISVQPLDAYQLEVCFSDGRRGVVSLKDRLFGPMFEPLRVVTFLRQTAIVEFGAICWPNGADLAPDALYYRIRPTVPMP
jgi:hypothetical protein